MPHGYMHSDQLTAVLSDGAAFKGFQEAQIRFPPTYKVSLLPHKSFLCVYTNINLYFLCLVRPGNTKV